VTVTYTHPGQGDLVNVQVWLPLSDWNNRFVGVGGGGFSTGTFGDDQISSLAYQGYAAAMTDGAMIPRHSSRPRGCCAVQGMWTTPFCSTMPIGRSMI
jgi:hypothetical protein